MANPSTKTIWSVQFTYHTDDYKPRGEAWTSTAKPKLFLSEAKARKYLREALVKRIHQRVADYCSDRAEPSWIEYFDEDDYELRKEHQKDMTIITEILEDIDKGEYVPCCFSWELSSLDLCDNEIELSEVEEEKQSEKKKRKSK